MKPMAFPEFFAAAPTIRVCDPLADFLGAARDGVIDYSYEGAVALAGHSCPTVAGAFLATRRALRSLYGEALPRRGEIAVDLREGQGDGVAGVVGAVAGWVTGAAGEGGFRGIGGHFSRRGTLRFAARLVAGEIRFTRLDSGAAVELSVRVGRVPGDPRSGEMMARCLSSEASALDRQSFRELWQERVRSILLHHADDPEVFVVHE